MAYRFADCVLDPATHSLTRSGAAVPVEPQVFDLLHLLVRHPGELVTKDRLIDEIWGGRIVSESAISARIAAARKAVGDNGQAQKIIATVARRGLRFVAEIGADAPPEPALPSEPRDSSPIHFARADDGTHLAWTISGTGAPVYWIHHFPGHLELEWTENWDRALLSALTARFSLLRFDKRGSGLSGDGPLRAAPEDRARDLLSVADAAGYVRQPVGAYTGQCHDAIAFAALHPERVSALVLLGGYVDGRGLRAGNASDDSGADSLGAILKDSWGRPESSFLRAFGMAYLPDATAREQADIAQWFFKATTLENTMAMRRIINMSSVAHLAPKVRCPTLLVHCRGDSVHPLSEARRLAMLIPNAELVVLDSGNHLPLPGEPAFARYLGAARSFFDRHATDT